MSSFFNNIVGGFPSKPNSLMPNSSNGTKTNLGIFWLKDESFEDTEKLPASRPHEIFRHNTTPAAII